MRLCNICNALYFHLTRKPLLLMFL